VNPCHEKTLQILHYITDANQKIFMRSTSRKNFGQFNKSINGPKNSKIIRFICLSKIVIRAEFEFNPIIKVVHLSFLYINKYSCDDV
jgi:hypothetical protein